MLRPRIRETHPDFFLVFLALVVLHLALAVTSILVAHDTPLWVYFGGPTGLRLLGGLHLVILGLMVTGFYGPFTLVRTGALFSVTLYLLKFCLFTAAVVRSRMLPDVLDASFETSIFTAGLALVSVAAYHQPARPLTVDCQLIVEVL